MTVKSVVEIVLVITTLGLLGACASTSTIGDRGGKFSGAYAVVPAAGDIPYVPASNGKQARWSKVERTQILYLDKYCQGKLFHQLPGWAQAIAKEGGWSALAIAVGEGGFAAAFPGADIVRYMLGGLGYGFTAGMNTGRYRQSTSEKSAQGYCVEQQVRDANHHYHILGGIEIIPWFGNGRTTLPKAADSSNKPMSGYINGGGYMPFPPGQ